MEVKILDYFIERFSNLKRDTAHGEQAPNKPILLLAVIQLFENQVITNNQIYISAELTFAFSRIWNAFVTNKDKHPRFALPFYHLKNEKGNWWNLIPNSGCETWIDMAGSMRTFSNLSTAVAYAEINSDLAELLKNKETREVLKQLLLTEYFPKSESQLPDYQSDKYVEILTKQVLEESPAIYEANMKVLSKNESQDVYQVEVFNRSDIFRRQIISLYDETCAMSGLCVSAPFTITMVDACHIEQFAKTFNNHPTNGIALCPNLHRAFDRGVVSLNDNYEIILSKSFKENVESDYSFHKLAGKSIILPSNSQYYPSLESFAWHRKNVFKL
jgi:putative restriction endonuclease